MAKQSKNRGGGHATSVSQIAASADEFTLVLGAYNNVTATWTVSLAYGVRADLKAWIWVPKSGVPFQRVQALNFAANWDDEACPDIDTYLLGGGQEVQAYAEVRDAQGELFVRSAIFSGTYSVS